MRGLGRLRRVWRRLQGRLLRPAAIPSPEELLANTLTASCLKNGSPDAALLRAAFRPIHDEEALLALAARPEADLGLRDMADAVLAGRQPYFDHELEQDLPPDWRRSPRYHSSIGREAADLPARWPWLPTPVYYHSDEYARGDARRLWELGRLQTAPLLVAASRLEMNDNPAAAEERIRAAMDLLASFRDHNAVDWGPHWIAGLEAGLRIFSLLWTWQLLPPDRAAQENNDEHTLLLTASLLENARFLAGHLSDKEIANNHLVGEAAALYCLGCALPVFPESVAWRELGLELLKRELQRQVLTDGVQGEQAIEYHRFVLEFYIQALLWGRAAGDPAPEAWCECLRAMFRPLAALTTPDGRIISIGDDDGGRVLRLDSRSRRDTSALLALGSRLLGVENLGPLARDCVGETIWLLGPKPYETAGGDLPAIENFGDAGWHTVRFGARDANGLPGGHLFFKSGPMGRGGGGHSHADQLSVCLSMGGRRIFDDPGTCLYNGPMEIRDWFRGPRAHNILRIEQDAFAAPNAAPDRFGWSLKGRSRLLRKACEGEWCIWEALREGDIGPGGEQLSCLRRVALHARGPIVIMDTVLASGSVPERLKLHLDWHLAPGLQSSVWEDDRALVTGDLARSLGGFALEIRPMPVAGAESAREGEPSTAGPADRRSEALSKDGGDVETMPPLLSGMLFRPLSMGLVPDPTPTNGLSGSFSRGYGVLETAERITLAGQAPPPWLLVSVLNDPSGSFLMGDSVLSEIDGLFKLEISGQDDDRILWTSA